MTAPLSILERQYQHLRQLVQDHKKHYCHKVLTDAEASARQIIRNAYQQARSQLHEAVDEERFQAQQQLDTAHAQRQTRARQAEHKAALLMLQDGWEQLNEVLILRWQCDDARRDWIEGLYQQAVISLPRCSWHIEHPPLWSEEEREQLADKVHRHCGQAPRFEPLAAIQAGLHIHSDGAHLDGSHKGLLADRHDIEARLLATIQQLMGEQGKP